MRRLYYATTAERDLNEIETYILSETGDPKLAETIVGRIMDRCEHLADLSGTMGRPRPELRPDVRSFPFAGYLIFFRYEDDDLVVLNILSGRSDIDAYFDEDD